MFQREPFTSCPVTGTSEKFGSIAFCPHQVQGPGALSSAGWTRVVSSWGCHGELLASRVLCQEYDARLHGFFFPPPQDAFRVHLTRPMPCLYTLPRIVLQLPGFLRAAPLRASGAVPCSPRYPVLTFSSPDPHLVAHPGHAAHGRGVSGAARCRSPGPALPCPRLCPAAWARCRGRAAPPAPPLAACPGLPHGSHGGTARALCPEPQHAAGEQQADGEQNAFCLPA